MCYTLLQRGGVNAVLRNMPVVRHFLDILFLWISIEFINFLYQACFNSHFLLSLYKAQNVCCTLHARVFIASFLKGGVWSCCVT